MRAAARPPLVRFAHIDDAIRAGRFPNAVSLATELEVHARTVQRDIEFLRDRLRAPLGFDRARNGYFYTDRTYRLPPCQFTEGELLALLLAERLLQEYRHTPYAQALATAFAKITAYLPETVSIDLSHLTEAYSFRHQAPYLPSPLRGRGAGGEGDDAERFAQLDRAIRAGRQLELVYWSASRDQTLRRVVDPYHLASVDGDWFLVGHCHLREEIRMFAPARIQALRETGARFERPADFRIADYLDAGFRTVRGTGPPRTVRLRFAPRAARYIRERRWHTTQQLTAEPDGSLVLTLAVNHLLEVRRWALSFGADCTVLEPAELREEMAAEIARLAQQYAQPPGE